MSHFKMALADIISIGLTLMILSFISGFTVGGHLIFLALAWWIYFLFTYNKTKGRIAIGLFAALSLVESYLLNPSSWGSVTQFINSV